MESIDYSKLKAKPEKEDFKGKYEDTNFISKFLVKNYYKSVEKLIAKINNINSVHEIGVGEGRSTQILKKIFPEMTASEYVESQVKIAQKLNPDIKIFQESVYELEFENNSTDLLILLEVLEHLDYPELAIKELLRVSKKYLIIGVPNEPIWRLLNICRLKYLKDIGNTPGHLNHWSKNSLVKIVEDNFGKVIALESPLPWTIVLAEKLK